MQDITFVGLDVHKATVAVSVAAAGRDGEVRHPGRLENRPRWCAGSVRMEAGRLRRRLERDYLGAGLSDAVRDRHPQKSWSNRMPTRSS